MPGGFFYCMTRAHSRILPIFVRINIVMKKLFLLVFSILLMIPAFSQDKKPFITLDNLQLSTRADFTLNYHPGHDTVAPIMDLQESIWW